MRPLLFKAPASAPFETCGSVADWQKSVGSLVTGHSRGVFAVSVAFAGPLLGLIGLEGGGFHFYGQSSRGKSTLVEAAASVWERAPSPASFGLGGQPQTLSKERPRSIQMLSSFSMNLA